MDPGPDPDRIWDHGVMDPDPDPDRIWNHGVMDPDPDLGRIWRNEDSQHLTTNVLFFVIDRN